MVDEADAVLTNRIVIGLLSPNAAQTARADVAPLVAGTPVPDGQITIADLLVILRKGRGQVNF
jgi:hypothetical protein